MRVLFFISLVCCFSNLFAQNSVSVGLQLSPTISTILDKGTISNYGYQGSLNFGATVVVQRGRWAFTSGISHQKLGTRFETEHTTTDFPGGTGDFYDVYINTYTIVLPLRIHYNIPLGEKLNFFPIAGVHTGYMNSQKLQYTNQFVSPPIERNSSIILYSEFYLALFAGAGFNYIINQDWSFDIIPGCSYQIDTLKLKSSVSTTLGILAFSLELGVKYKLR